MRYERLRGLSLLSIFRLRSRAGCGMWRPVRIEIDPASNATLLQEGSMKKVLLATSALVATAGFASAQGGGG